MLIFRVLISHCVICFFSRLTGLSLSNDYNATGLGMPGRKPQMVSGPDSMVKTRLNGTECWEAWGPEFNPRLGRVGVQFLYKMGQPPKTFISYSLLSVAPIIGRDYFEEFHIHFLSSFMLSLSTAYIKKLSFLHV